MVDLSRYNLSELTPYQPGEDDFGGGSINYGALGADLLARAHTLLPEWFPAGKRAGHEFKVGNLSGDAGNSLSINMTTGVWTDFGSDEKGGADLTSLYAAQRGMSQHDAAMELSNGRPPSSGYARGTDGYGGNGRNAAPTPKPAPAPKTRDWKVPAPWQRLHPCVHFVHGKPSNKWPYLSEDGKLIGYVARYDTAGSKKEFCPWTWNGSAWQAKKWVGLQPLYGMELLALRIKDPVLVVEGEKACDAARKICGDEYVCVTWPFGATAYRETDWSPLAGREVVLWPDADKAGVDAAKGITALLAQIAARTATLDISDKPAKWDAADALADGWDRARFDQWVGAQFGGGAAAANVVALREVGAKATQDDAGAQGGAPTAGTKSAAKAGPVMPEQIEPPPELLQLPGMLGKIMDWSMRTATRPQAIYSAAAALALGSVLMGRRYRTDMDNFSALYFLLLGRTSTGKEYIKTTISTLLRAAGLESLIGGSLYTSDEAVHNELREHATTIHTTDEFGIQLKAAKSAGSSHPQNVNRVFMELFSECASFNPGKAFSTGGMNKANKAEFAPGRRKIIKPSMTIMALTTPEIFYQEIGGESLRSGFLNRFISMECYSPATTARAGGMTLEDKAVPQEIIDWMRKVRFGDMCDEAGAGNLLGLLADAPSYEEPTLWEMTFAPACAKALAEIDEFCVARLNDDNDPLRDMWGRTREKGMRLSMQAARACNSMVIELENVEWAMKFVKFFDAQTIRAAGANISENDLDAAIQDVRRLVAKAGTGGMSRKQLRDMSRKFKALAPRMQQEVWTHLQVDGEHRALIKQGERGPGTIVLVLAELLEGGEK